MDRKKQPPTRSHLTTGEASRLLGISNRTVCKLFDAGAFTGFRLNGTLPEDRGHNGDRRISRQSFLAYCQSNGIVPPIPTQVVLTICPGDTTQSLRLLLPSREFVSASNLCDLGYLHAKHLPTTIIADASLIGLEGLRIIASTSRSVAGYPVRHIAILPDDITLRTIEGYDAVLQQPFPAVQLAGLLLVEAQK